MARRLAPRDRRLAVLLATSSGTIVVALVLLATGRISVGVAAAVALGVNTLVAGAGAVVLMGASRRSDGRQQRVWLLLAAGCAVWAAGALPYTVFLFVGGSVTEPAAWSQIGFLLAYIPWFRALWLMRQPVVAESRMRVLEVILMECATLAMSAVVVLGVLWQRELGVASNAALLLPAVLDLLLVAAAYNAVRRASLDPSSAYPWLVAAFLALGIADAGSSWMVARGHLTAMLMPLCLYCLVFVLLGLAAGRPLKARELALAGERVTGAVAALGLALVGPAAFLAPGVLAPAVWVLGAALAWRVHSLLRRQGRTDEDLITGLLDGRPMRRHMAGLIAGASSRQPVAVIAVDINGFGSWNAAHGFSAGDQILAEVAERCAATPIGAGVWGRTGPDRFCWVGPVNDLEQAREWAGLAGAMAAENAAALRVRAAVVLCPADASTAANAEAAADEALAAASRTERDVVAFDRGLLDGATVEGGYSASFQARRERIAAVIDEESTIAPVFQPIVRLDTLAVMGHEALSRFNCEPRRGPDQWISDAHQVGLGLELESECLRRALAHRGAVPDGTYLSVNASPQLILSGGLAGLVPDGDLSWLLIEITEHEQVRDYGQLADRLGSLRMRGALVAVDDLGAGHSTLRHLMRLGPGYAKLDRSLVQDIDTDPAKQALVRSMVAFGREMGCSLVAEGVETLAELQVLREIGIVLGQGYLFERPAPEMARTLTSVTPGLVPCLPRPQPTAVPDPGDVPMRRSLAG